MKQDAWEQDKRVKFMIANYLIEHVIWFNQVMY